MEKGKIRISLKNHDSNSNGRDSSESESTLTFPSKANSESRSRSRSPNAANPLNRLGGSNGNSNGSNGSLSVPYRDRSSDRSIDKLQKAQVFRNDVTSINDIPLMNTSFNNTINNPEHQEEQNSRGRRVSREDPKIDDSIVSNMGDGDHDDDQPDDNMISLMGFSGFGTTKGKHVKGSKGGASVKQEKKTEYRQYMNRSKGFNRPLSPGR
ncbi:hypothetical protein DFJ63DRAFT_163089 [Scheffersomyces coipomensis]|uniref:uncharacterized protein n=1 Tax=Scheffersomyces coipomensis TaxID=1788519 RepID=UPI00315D6F80